MALSQRELLRRGIRTPQSGDVGIGSRPSIILNKNLEFLNEVVTEHSFSPQAESVAKDRRGIKMNSRTADFRRSFIFQDAYSIASNRIEKFPNVDEFEKWFFGNMFAHFAWREMSLSANSEEIILPESYMPEVFSKAAGVKTITHNGSEMGDWRYLPDGLMISANDDQKQINAMYEYTLSVDFWKFVNQFHGFRHAKQDLGDIAKSADFVFIIPAFSEDKLEKFRQNLLDSVHANSDEADHLKIKPLEITHGEFVKFVNYAYRGYKPNDETQPICDRVSEYYLTPAITISKQNRRLEFARQALSALEGDRDAAEYVARFSHNYAQPVKGSGGISIVTLPRISPKSIGEPSIFVKPSL